MPSQVFSADRTAFDNSISRSLLVLHVAKARVPAQDLPSLAYGNFRMSASLNM